MAMDQIAEVEKGKAEAAKEFTKQFSTYADAITTFVIAQDLVFLFALATEDLRKAILLVDGVSLESIVFKVGMFGLILGMHVFYRRKITYCMSKEKEFREIAIPLEEVRSYVDQYTTDIYKTRLSIVFYIGCITNSIWVLLCLLA